MSKKPLIGISGNILIMEGGMFPGIERSYVNHDYVNSVSMCGGIPIIIPVNCNRDDLINIVSRLDGLVLSGGYDITSWLYGEEPISKQGFNYEEVDKFYIALIKVAVELKKPILGICKGIQAINVAFGGTLYQDLSTQIEGSLKHKQDGVRYQASHLVTIKKDTFLSECLPSNIKVNSYHHQAIRKVADGFKVVAVAKDGVVEAIEYEGGNNFILGVQWHPEMMAAFHNYEMQELFKKFIQITSND